MQEERGDWQPANGSRGLESGLRNAGQNGQTLSRAGRDERFALMGHLAEARNLLQFGPGLRWR